MKFSHEKGPNFALLSRLCITCSHFGFEDQCGFSPDTPTIRDVDIENEITMSFLQRWPCSRNTSHNGTYYLNLEAEQGACFTGMFRVTGTSGGH